MKYLQFIEKPPSKSGKTKVWEIRSIDWKPEMCGNALGQIYWFARWRRYVFHAGPAIFDADCLQELQTFLRNVNYLHKENLKKQKTEVKQKLESRHSGDISDSGT